MVWVGKAFLFNKKNTNSKQICKEMKSWYSLLLKVLVYGTL